MKKGPGVEPGAFLISLSRQSDSTLFDSSLRSSLSDRSASLRD